MKNENIHNIQRIVYRLSSEKIFSHLNMKKVSYLKERTNKGITIFNIIKGIPEFEEHPRQTSVIYISLSSFFSVLCNLRGICCFNFKGWKIHSHKLARSIKSLMAYSTEYIMLKNIMLKNIIVPTQILMCLS